MKLIKSIILLNILLLAVQFALTTKMSTMGLELARLSAELNELSSKNAKSRLTLQSLSSLENIASQVDHLSLKPIAIEIFQPKSIAVKH